MKSYMKEMKANLPALLFAAFVGGLGILFASPVIGGGGVILAAVVTVKSLLITNRDATPAVIKSRILQGATVHHCRGVVAIANGDSATSKYLFFAVPSNAVPISVRVTAPDIGTTTTMDIGLYKVTRDGSAVVDADAFTAAKVLNAGAIAKSESVAGNLQTVANSEKMLWELLGLTSDPQIPYDVVGTLVGAADAAGSVLIEMEYVVG